MWVPNLANLGKPKEAPAPPPKELFLSSANAALKEVVDKEEKPLAEGTLRLVEDPKLGGVTATVGEVSWSFKKEGHVMASILNEHHEYTYLFAGINGNPDKFFCVVLTEAFPEAERSSLEEVLREHATYHVSERKQKGFMLPSLNEIMAKAKHDTAMLMGQAARAMQGGGGSGAQPTGDEAAAQPDAAPAPQQ